MRMTDVSSAAFSSMTIHDDDDDAVYYAAQRIRETEPRYPRILQLLHMPHHGTTNHGTVNHSTTNIKPGELNSRSLHILSLYHWYMWVSGSLGPTPHSTTALAKCQPPRTD